ncbi:MAG: 16S rRNA (guanine(527)-N(7))-methyltransferase RsmG [Thermoanaerobaculales bacterium]|nr:16S rRNA (guanine(527)-N(7))-methyltransferase RsmG [Thermoanaerobaculales bacterium]
MPVPAFRDLLAGHLDGEALDRMVSYAELLERWSAHHNLVRVANRRELVERHLLDALAGAELLGATGRLLDVGSGAGLPGVPLLIVRPGWRGVLLEPRQKRWAFLKRTIRELGLDAEALAVRYQELGGDRVFDLVTMRAVGGLGDLVEWARDRLAAGGGVALWTTEDGEREMANQRGWRVLSSPLVGLERGRLVYLQAERPCFT